jgi:DNA ligase D-like protein (predicted 3'-phosphoesterase)
VEKGKKQDFLDEYHKKRDFDLTSEPFGEDKNRKDSDKQIFVIQKHDATNLHYDFRLLVDGVLKSWVLPKGPSTDPKETRLAIPTEDHPAEYADFEGTIPRDEYGGGTVMVWDAGTYQNDKTDDSGNEIPIKDQLEEGHSTFILKGKKISGGYALIRTEKGDNEKWIFKKMKDDQADARRNPVSTENKSVLTGRSMEEIEKESGEDH